MASGGLWIKKYNLFRVKYTEPFPEPSDDSSLGGAAANIEMSRPSARPGLTWAKLPGLHTVVTVEDKTLVEGEELE